MSPEELENLRFPIGKFEAPERIATQLEKYIDILAAFPKLLKNEVAHLNHQQLDTPYRPEGWTIRQVVHHCADSHLNSFTRFKLALTEDSPVIRPYYEDQWAELSDSRLMDVMSSIILLEGLHQRWAFLLHSLTPMQLQRNFIHPEQKKKISLEMNLALYAWHCNHHLAHIMTLKKKNNWL